MKRSLLLVLALALFLPGYAQKTSGFREAVMTAVKDPNTQAATYVLQAGSQSFVVKESYRILNRKGCLWHKLPGTKVLIRTDEKSRIFVKIDDKEWKYDIIEAE